MPMKIAQVCPYDFFRHGGVKTHILQLSEALRAHGHEVKIIAPKTGDQEQDGNIFFFGKNYSLGFGGTKIDVNACLGKERKRLQQFLNDEQFDLIHFHTIWNPLLPWQVLRLAARVRKVATFHDTPGRGPIPRFLGRYVMPWAARFVFRYLDGIISVSASQAAYLTRQSNRKVHIIPNGLDLTAAKPCQSRGDKLRVLFLGRLEPRKGILEALTAYQNLCFKMPAEMIVAGEGALLKQAQLFVSENQLTDVSFVGAVTDPEKWALLASTDVYIASALYGESFGIVLLEAMASGVPMAGFLNEGYRNVLSAKQAAYFATPGDVAGLTSALREVATNDGLRNDLIAEGRRVVQAYDWQTLVLQVLEVYGR